VPQGVARGAPRRRPFLAREVRAVESWRPCPPSAFSMKGGGAALFGCGRRNTVLARRETDAPRRGGRDVRRGHWRRIASCAGKGIAARWPWQSSGRARGRRLWPHAATNAARSRGSGVPASRTTVREEAWRQARHTTRAIFRASREQAPRFARCLARRGGPHAPAARLPAALVRQRQGTRCAHSSRPATARRAVSRVPTPPVTPPAAARPPAPRRRAGRRRGGRSGAPLRRGAGRTRCRAPTGRGARAGRGRGCERG